MRSSLTGLLIIVILIPAVWFGVWPLWQKVSVARTHVSDLKETIVAERAANEKLLSIAKSIEERKSDVETLENSILKKRDDATLIAVFEEAASNNGLVLNEINIQPRVETPTTEEVATLLPGPLFESASATIQLEGTYTSFNSFLVDVEHSFPLVDIGQISFDPLDEDGGGATDTFNFEVSLTSYHLK